MSAPGLCTAQLRKQILHAPFSSQLYGLLPCVSPTYSIVRHATQSSRTRGKPDAREDSAKKKKKKVRTETRINNLKYADQFSLCDAMRYIRAFEVGRPPTSAKYEMHLRIRTLKSGPVVRNSMRLPLAVKTNIRICVICAPDSPAAAAAKRAGAVLIGEDVVFDAVKAGRIEFDRCLCHTDSAQKLNKAGLGRILGPRGLMPSNKFGTITRDIEGTVRKLVGSSEYREREGVVRMAVGQLGFTPEEMRTNIKAFMDSVKRDVAQLSEKINKDIHEVVLSSTNAPGFILNGEFRSPASLPTQELSVI